MDHFGSTISEQKIDYLQNISKYFEEEFTHFDKMPCYRRVVCTTENCLEIYFQAKLIWETRTTDYISIDG